MGVKECGEGLLNLFGALCVLDATEISVYLIVLSLSGTKISDKIMGAALASCLAKAEKLAALK